MDFGLTETQELIRASAAEWLSERSGPEFVRAMAEDEQGYTDEYWRELAGLGWLGLLIPEEHGGSGMQFADMAVLLHEWGAALAPGPLVESSVVAASLIADSDSDDTRSRLLSEIASGESVIIPAVTSLAGEGGRITASETAQGWVLGGAANFVPYENTADTLLIPATTDAGVAIFALNTGLCSGTVTETPIKMASGVPTYDLGLNEVVCPSAAMMISPSAAEDAIRRAKSIGATARAVQMVGAGKAVLDRTLEYVKERRQFGRPIGAFQAIQHYMADMALKVKSAQLMVQRAAWAIDNVDDERKRHELVSQAKWAANMLMPQVCWTAHQVHGAIGFTWEHDLHLYTRRMLSWRAEYGDTEDTRTGMTRHLGDYGNQDDRDDGS